MQPCALFTIFNIFFLHVNNLLCNPTACIFTNQKMTTKIVELRQERGHICSNFDGYKLSLEPVPLLRQELNSAPFKAEPNDEQYSLLHAELFSMQNLLVVDPWARTQSYFINRQGEITRCSYEENKGRPDAMQVVYRLEQLEGKVLKRKGDYNYSLRFISEKYCVLCDGEKKLVLLDTGDRQKANEWQQIVDTKIDGNDVNAEERDYVIYDARLDVIKEQKQISLALGHVQRIESTSPDTCTTHFMYLHWAKWLLNDKVWQFDIVDTLEGKGSLFYCAFEPRSESLVISSNRALQWRSKKSTTEVEIEKENSVERPQLHDEPKDENLSCGYTWSQTVDDIILKFEIKTGKDKNDYSVKSDFNKITVKCNEQILLDAELAEKIDRDLTTWTVEKNFVQITLVKDNNGLPWLSLLAHGLGPRETNEGNLQNCMAAEQQPIANLETPIEDCDFPMDQVEDEISICRFNLPTKHITHTVIMGSTPPLFITSLRPGFPLAVATRQDVDASLWLQHYNPAKPQEWSLRHEGNLHAFGYVQASKQQKKFMDCSPDMGYAVITESHRHVFLYKSKYDTASGLRNRSGPQVSLGKQHLIALEDVGEVLGLCTANSVVTLLTEKCVLFIQLES